MDIISERPHLSVYHKPALKTDNLMNMAQFRLTFPTMDSPSEQALAARVASANWMFTASAGLRVVISQL